MKSALLIPTIAAALCVASPASACRIPWRADAPVAFTATIESLERHEGVFSGVRATLRIRRRIEGPSRDIEEAGASPDIVTGWCHPRADYDAELLDARAGDELIVIGGSRNGGLAIYDLGRLTTARGRELLAQAEAARP